MTQKEGKKGTGGGRWGGRIGEEEETEEVGER